MLQNNKQSYNIKEKVKIKIKNLRGLKVNIINLKYKK